MKVSFYKENNSWYADVPYVPKRNNLMVAGADTFLDSICQGKDRVTVTVSTNLKSRSKSLYFLVRCEHDFWGATYLVCNKGEKCDSERKLWLCNVTHFVLGRHPKIICITNIS